MKFLDRAVSEPPPDALLPGLLRDLARAESLTGGNERAITLAERALRLTTSNVEQARTLDVLGHALIRELGRTGTRREFDVDGRAIQDRLQKAADNLPENERELRFGLETTIGELISTRGAMLGVPMTAAETARLERLAGEISATGTNELACSGEIAVTMAQRGSTAVEACVGAARRALASGTIAREFGRGAPLGGPLEALMCCDGHAEAEEHLADAARHAQRHGVPPARR